MSAKITVIADKDVGHVLGAVLEVNATDKLKVDQVVASAGFPIRDGAAVLVQVPPNELDTFATTTASVLDEPMAYAVVDGTVLGTASTNMLTGVALKATEVTFTPAAAADKLKFKAIYRRRLDGQLGTLTARELRGPATGSWTYPTSELRIGDRYDVLVMLQNHRPLLLIDTLVS
jgi:hypothetical protein